MVKKEAQEKYLRGNNWAADRYREKDGSLALTRKGKPTRYSQIEALLFYKYIINAQE